MTAATRRRAIPIIVWQVLVGVVLLVLWQILVDSGTIDKFLFQPASRHPVADLAMGKFRISVGASRCDVE